MARAPLFSGKNRKHELRRLKRAYDTVAGAAGGLRPGDQARKPIHAVALIHAERGQGKTRLAMELYRYLTTSCDPDGYWPDDPEMIAEPVTVMPPAERINFAAELPFLWWGMAVADDPNPGNTIFGTLEDLLPHLTAARIAGQRRDSARSLGAEAADLAVDLGLELSEVAVNVAGEALGLGVIKRLGQGMWNIRRIVHRHSSHGGDDSEIATRQIVSVVDAVMADLSRLFSPQSPTYCGKPLVILIDDAQFADGDPAMAAFLERLIARCGQEYWPLLLLITHWDKELGNFQAADGTNQPRSHVANVLRHARDRREVDPGRYAGQRGGMLSDARYIDVNLDKGVDDLRPAMIDRFPGIARATATQILAKAGRNPRMLEQIMARMERKPIWFLGADLMADLTRDGQSAVSALSDLPLEEVVLERFRDTPENVRSALVLASLIGNRFVVDLVDRLSTAQLQHPARAGLEDGEARYRFVRGVADQSRNDIADFAERLFHHAATEYRESGLAHAEITGFPAEQDLAHALDGLLNQLVRTPADFVGLSDDDLSVALLVAANRMSQTEIANAGLALARLVAVEDGRGNPEGAYAAADRFIANGALGRDEIIHIPAHLVDQIATALMRRGDRMSAEGLWLTLHGNAMAQAERDPENTEWQRDLSISHNKVGDIRVATGDRDGARKAFEAGMEIARKLARRDPENTQWQRDLSISHERVGDIRVATGDRDGARKAFEAGMEIARKLARRDPENTEWQRDLSISHERVGDIRVATGDRDGARKAFEAGMEIREKLARRDPENTQWQRDLSISHNKVGDIRVATGDRDGARKAFEAGMEIARKLARRDPENTEWQRDLSISHERVGDIRVATGDRDGARKAFEAGMEIARKLARRDPENTQWQRDLSISHERVGDIRVATGDRDGARKAFEAGMEIREKLARRDPENTQWQRDLIVGRVKLAESGADPSRHYAAALKVATTLAHTDRLRPVDEWIIPELEQRLANSERDK